MEQLREVLPFKEFYAMWNYITKVKDDSISLKMFWVDKKKLIMEFVAKDLGDVRNMVDPNKDMPMAERMHGIPATQDPQSPGKGKRGKEQ